jgi:hypothetical protein
MDLNNDGFLDLAVGSGARGSVAIFFGLPNLRFRLDFVRVSGTPIYVTHGHFLSRRSPDIAVLTETVQGGPTAVSLLLNDGLGAFEERVVTVPARTGSLAVGDFDRGGLDDLLIHSAEALVFYRGDGRGNFIATQQIKGQFLPTSIAVGDIDGDGRLDVVASVDRSTLTVLLNDGEGRLTRRMELRARFSPPAVEHGAPPPAPLVFGALPVTPILVDVDHDGRLDIVIPAVTEDFASAYLKKPSDGPLPTVSGPTSFLVIFQNRLHRSR